MSAPPGPAADRLERLAAHAPTGALDPDALWGSGRRRQRLRVGAALAAVVVVGLLGTVTTPLLVERADQVAPAGSDDRMVLPDVLRQPGGWEPSFPNPPGRLSAVGAGSKGGLLSGSNAWWGVSAATGESRFLDLPGAATDSSPEPALSADGRRLAYWVTGQVDGVPVANGEMGDGLEPVVGVAVLDLETGTRDVWTVASEHGLFVGGLAWAGDALWWSAGPVRVEDSSAFSASMSTRTWNVATGERDEGPSDAGRLSLSELGDAPGGFVERWGKRRLTRVLGDAEPTTLRLVMPAGTPGRAGVTQPTMSPDGARVAALLVPDASRYDEDPKTVLVGGVSGRDVRLQRLDGVEEQGIVGWRSPTEVVAVGLAAAEDGHGPRAVHAWTLDVTTGNRSELMDFEGNTPQVAAEAWTAEVVPAPDAPFAPDPRLVGAGAIVVLAFGISLWRDLRRRRGHP
jgi:hypothetical protein